MNNDYNFGNENEQNGYNQSQQPAQSGFQPQQPQDTAFTQPQYTQPQYEQPQYTQPQYNQQQYTQPQYQPQYAQPQANQQYSQPQTQYQEQYQQNPYQQQTYAQPDYNQGYNPYYTHPNNEAELNSLAGGALTMGILSLAFCEIPLLSILGIIFGAVGRGKAGRFNTLAGKLFGKAKVGSILAKVGMILSIVMTAFWGLYILLILAAMSV